MRVGGSLWTNLKSIVCMCRGLGITISLDKAYEVKIKVINACCQRACKGEWYGWE